MYRAGSMGGTSHEERTEVGTVQPWTLTPFWVVGLLAGPPTSTSSFSLFISAGQKYESPEEKGKGSERKYEMEKERKEIGQPGEKQKLCCGCGGGGPSAPRQATWAKEGRRKERGCLVWPRSQGN